jgi:ATP-dependent helicase HrpA
LILAGALLKFNDERGKLFEIVIQSAAILAVVWEFRARIAGVLGGLRTDAKARRLLLNVGVAFLPLAVLGLLFGKFLKSHLFNAPTVATTFILGAFVILWAERRQHRVRVRVLDDAGRELCASRDLAEVQSALHQRQREASVTVARAEPAAWQRARARWEKPGQTEWTFGNLPPQVLVTEQAGMPVYAYPGLQAGEQGVGLRLFKSAGEAQSATEAGLAVLFGLQLRYDLGWLERDLKALRELGPLTATLAPLADLQTEAFGSIRRWLTDAKRIEAGRVSPNAPAAHEPADLTRRIRVNPPCLTQAAFTAALEKSRADLHGLVPRLVDQLREILTLRQALLVHPQPYPGFEREIVALVPPDFLRVTPYAQLAHFPRYLKTLRLRADRWRQNPAKDAERAAQLAPYMAAVAKVQAQDGGGAFRWLVEEFRVSLFAQELGTAEPVSAVKLDRLMAALTGPAGASLPAEAASIRPLTAASAKKPAPLKSLGALDRLFRKPS